MQTKFVSILDAATPTLPGKRGREGEGGRGRDRW